MTIPFDESYGLIYTDSMPRVIAVANQKGGVGKTTTVMNLGAEIAARGFRVVMVDLDPQGALTVSFGQDPYSVKPSAYELLFNNYTSLEVPSIKVRENLTLVPANAELVASEYKLLKEADRIRRLRNAIRVTVEPIDYILIDTPPSLGLLTINSLVAADELLIPVATDYLSMRGVRALLESVWLIRERVNPDLRLLCLLPTLYRENSPHSNSVIKEMSRVFKHKVTRHPIPLDDAASAAPAARQTLNQFAPESKAATAYRLLAQEITHVHIPR